MAVAVVGSINVDLVLTVDALPSPGETVLASRSTRLPGGKGANQAVAAARFGATTRLTAAVGDDEGGQWMRQVLSSEGIDTSGVESLSGQDTGLATIAVDARGENQIIVSSGANALLSPDKAALLKSDTKVVLAQQEVPPEAILAAFTVELPAGAIRMLNAAPALTGAANLLDHTDILIVNQHELAEYLGLAQAPANAAEALIAQDLLRFEGQTIIVTLGAGGALAVSSAGHFYAPAVAVSPRDTIGAGDCFCGVLAALLDTGAPLEKAISSANAAAALCTQRQGAVPAMPTRAEVKKFVG
ncbi:ribokinase [Aurantiacibacter flavus]|uniref:Ribokinase n=1 Tax=Aurantiacibacter flavus TaxID=3145232 RepID=A0ABV0D0T3_9SPHN